MTTRNAFVKMMAGAAFAPSALLAADGGALGCKRCGGREDRARREVQQQLDYQLIGGAVFCSTDDPNPVAMGTRLHSPERKDALSPDALFDMASVTKTIVATASAQLVADGLLDPDAPFTKYLPEHVLSKTGCDITVRDLATHSGGFDNARPYLSKKADFPGAFWKKRPAWKRGERYCYSCYNLILIGRIVERASGKRLDAFCKERIFDPLGMADTRWWPVAEVDRSRAVQFAPEPELVGIVHDPQARKFREPVGNAGVFSTAGDMLAFVTDLLRRRTFRKETYDLLFTPTFEKDAGRRSWGWDMSDGSRPEGWSRSTILHSGFTGHTVAADPEAGFAAVVLTSRTAEHETGRICRARVLSILHNKEGIK